MITLNKAGVESPELAVDAPFAQGVIPPNFPKYAPHVRTNFLNRFDEAGREFIRVYGPLSELGEYLIRAWGNDPFAVLKMLANAYDYAEHPQP